MTNKKTLLIYLEPTKLELEKKRTFLKFSPKFRTPKFMI